MLPGWQRCNVFYSKKGKSSWKFLLLGQVTMTDAAGRFGTPGEPMPSDHSWQNLVNRSPFGKWTVGVWFGIKWLWVASDDRRRRDNFKDVNRNSRNHGLVGEVFTQRSLWGRLLPKGPTGPVGVSVSCLSTYLSHGETQDAPRYGHVCFTQLGFF